MSKNIFEVWVDNPFTTAETIKQCLGSWHSKFDGQFTVRKVTPAAPPPEQATATVDWKKPIRHSDTREPLHLAGMMTLDGKRLIEHRDGRLSAVNDDGSISNETSWRVENVSPEKVICYVNIFKLSDGSLSYGPTLNRTRKAADESFTVNRVGCQRVEFTEGRYDE